MWSPELAASLQERFVTERRGRLVLPIKTSHRRKGMGLVHGRSKTGETVFVEPAEVLELQNQLDDSELELEQAIARILRALSQRLGEEAERVREALEVAGEIDAARARAQLGRRLEGVIPDTEQDGVLELREMRHPLLLLQGVDVVANDLLLSSEQPSLILTGPNTGGKTIALKCMGLAALMVHAGIPLPAAPGVTDLPARARRRGRLSLSHRPVDLLGTPRDPTGDSPLRGAQRADPPDEIAAGTDPVEELPWLERAWRPSWSEARCVVTTRHTELKALGMVDERFQVAGMTHLEDNPATGCWWVRSVSHTLCPRREAGTAQGGGGSSQRPDQQQPSGDGALLDRLEEQEQEHEAIRQRLSALEQDARSRQRSLRRSRSDWSSACDS